MKLITPYGFRERMLLIGGGGAGKTTAALSMMDAALGALADDGAAGYVIDLDYSRAWQRAIDIDFTDLDGRVHVSEVFPEWEPVIAEVQRITQDTDANRPDNWLVIDSVSPTWDLVQSWYVELAMGRDIAGHMAQLKRENSTQNDYAAALAETMNWPAIKKEYAKLYYALQSWRGHFVLTAEAKSIKGERDGDQLALYGPVGYKPVGDGRLSHVPATTLFLKNDAGGYKFSTVKDRNRQKAQNEKVDGIEDGGFAGTYLRDRAGWQTVRPRRKQQVAEAEVEA